MPLNQIIHGDCIEVLQGFPENSVDLVVTDPPYGLGFMGKEWDKALPPKEAFMEMYRVLKPGALAFVMSSPRQDLLWRMCALLEGVGFELSQSFISWIYKTGFPKAYDVSKGIDKKRNGEFLTNQGKFSEYIKSQRELLGLTKTEVDKLVCGGSSMYNFWEGRKNENNIYSEYLPPNDKYKKLKEILNLDNRFDCLIQSNEKITSKIDGDFGYQKDQNRWKGKQKITEPNLDEAKKWDG